MNNDYKQQAIKFLQTHKFLTLATVDDNNQPFAATLGFASDGATLYFITDKKTRKIQNISNNQKIGYTVDEDEQKDWDEIQGLQMIGLAKIVTDQDEIERAKQLLEDKFPEFASLPPDPNHVVVKVTSVKGKFLDNTVVFGFSVDLQY